MADLDPIAPLIPTLPPAKGKGDRGRSGRRTEKPGRQEVDQNSDEKQRKPDGSTHQVDEYV